MIKAQVRLSRPARFLATAALIAVVLMFLAELGCWFFGALTATTFGFSLLAMGIAIISLGGSSLLGSVSYALDCRYYFQRIDKRRIFPDWGTQNTPDIPQSVNFALLLVTAGLVDITIGVLILNIL